MRKKLLAPVLAVCLAVFLLAGCMSTLPDGFDDGEITKRGNEAIGYFNDREFDKLIPLFAPEKQAELSVEFFNEKFGDALDKVGAYKDAEESQMQGQTSEDTGEEYVVAQVMLNYENGQLQHVLIFNQDSQLLAYRLGIVEE